MTRRPGLTAAEVATREIDRANRRAIVAIKEHDWQNTVIAHVERAGFMVHYIPDAMWRRAFIHGTPQKLGHRGFPDLVIAGKGRLFFRELKTERGDLSPFQVQWRDTLLAAGCDWELWRPSDLDLKVIPDLWGV